MEPFNLTEERGEGYFDQFLNYHSTKTKESDPYYKMMDEDKENDEEEFTEKYTLKQEIIRKHQRDYEKFESANTDIDLLNEWKSLLPLFDNNTQSITEAMQSLSAIVRKHGKSTKSKSGKTNDAQSSANTERVTKKRKVSSNGIVSAQSVPNEEDTNSDAVNGQNVPQNSNSSKKRKRKRAWEMGSDDENQKSNDSRNGTEEVSERELMGYRRKFEIFSEKATLLFANGDHNIYEQCRESLIQRIKLVEDEQLFKRHQQEALRRKELAEREKNHNIKRQTETVDDMLADFSDDAGDEDDDLMGSTQNGSNASRLVWHYRWKHDVNTIHGPFTSQQMIDWNDLYFKAQPVQFKRTMDEKWLCSDELDLVVCVQASC